MQRTKVDVFAIDLNFYYHNFPKIFNILHNSITRYESSNNTFEYLLCKIVFASGYIYSTDTITCKIIDDPAEQIWKNISINDAIAGSINFISRIVDDYIMNHLECHDYASSKLIERYKELKFNMFNYKESIRVFTKYFTEKIPRSIPRDQHLMKKYSQTYWYTWSDIIDIIKPYKSMITQQMIKIPIYKDKPREELFDYFLFLIMFSADNIHESTIIQQLMKCQHHHIEDYLKGLLSI